MFPSKNEWILIIAMTLVGAGLAFAPFVLSPGHHYERPVFPRPNQYVDMEIRVACTMQDTGEDLCPSVHEWMQRVHAFEQQSEVKQ